MGLILGVDGGGTKSTYKVFDTDTSSTKEVVGDSINFYSFGEKEACGSFEKILNSIRKDYSKEIDSICIGNAALGLDDVVSETHMFYKTVSRYCRNSMIVSDLYIGVKGTVDKPSIFIISGTGSMGVAETEDEKFYSIGGWGYLLGDQGSGYDIGLRGIKETLKSFDGIQPATTLQNSLLDYFEIKNQIELIDKIYNNKIENRFIANFAVEVHKAASSQDEIALKIIEESIDYLVACVKILDKNLNNKAKVVSVYGGNFQKSELFMNMFKQSVHKYRVTIKVNFPDYIPVDSALILAGDKININLRNNI